MAERYYAKRIVFCGCLSNGVINSICFYEIEVTIYLRVLYFMVLVAWSPGGPQGFQPVVTLETVTNLGY